MLVFVGLLPKSDTAPLLFVGPVCMNNLQRMGLSTPFSGSAFFQGRQTLR